MMIERRILFACSLNSVRSPMAAGLLEHLSAGRIIAEAAGVQANPINPFAVAVMQELGVDRAGYIAKTLQELPRADAFDQTIALSETALEAARTFPAAFMGEILFWDVPMPRHESEHRDRQLVNYRLLRDGLRQRIVTHFSL
jgi:protein-tyrosine-phosphatase